MSEYLEKLLQADIGSIMGLYIYDPFDIIKPHNRCVKLPTHQPSTSIFEELPTLDAGDTALLGKQPLLPCEEVF
jgi:hypothetical protein